MNHASQWDHSYSMRLNCATHHARIEDPKGMLRPHHHTDYELYFDGGHEDIFCELWIPIKKA